MHIDWYENLPNEVYPEARWQIIELPAAVGRGNFISVYVCAYCSSICYKPKDHLEACKSCLRRITVAAELCNKESK
jgi:hypothetical protein